jgi:nucleoporin NUP82
VGLAIPNDVYLTYSIFILTSAMRITSLKLALKFEPSPPASPIGPEEDEKHRYTVPLEGPSAYVSLLTDEPYVPPDVLSQPFGLPTNPRLSTGSHKEFTLTPETMRYLGKIVESFTQQIHAVQLAYRNSEVRRELQKQETRRQTEKCRELLELVDKLKGRRSGLAQFKLNKVVETQKALLKRLDRVLQALMEQASPKLSVYETKWFRELQRMKEEVVGARTYDGTSLVARTSLVRVIRGAHVRFLFLLTLPCSCSESTLASCLV